MGYTVKRLAILGSTGSIGRQTIDVVRAFPDRFRIIGLAAGENIDLLQQQIAEFRPKFVYCRNPEALQAGAGYQLLSIEEIARHPEVDTVVMATSGYAGLTPTLAAVRAGKDIALANKEALVAAGEIIMAEAKLYSARILPVDSEHSAIWQCLRGEETFPTRIILTASGGPFRHYTRDRLEKVTPARALKHPSWKMGRKITIDSATLVNKGLEVIEAHHLFDMPFENIVVVVHPECIVHSMVEFPDGVIKAQLGCPDMRIPIQFALSFPERLESPGFPRLDVKMVNGLTFETPDTEAFPGLTIAVEAGKKGGTYPAALVGADEAAVSLFLERKIRFTDIPHLIEEVLSRHTPTASPSLEEIIYAENWARSKAMQISTGV